MSLVDLRMSGEWPNSVYDEFRQPTYLVDEETQFRRVNTLSQSWLISPPLPSETLEPLILPFEYEEPFEEFSTSRESYSEETPTEEPAPASRKRGRVEETAYLPPPSPKRQRTLKQITAMDRDTLIDTVTKIKQAGKKVSWDPIAQLFAYNYTKEQLRHTYDHWKKRQKLPPQ